MAVSVEEAKADYIGKQFIQSKCNVRYAGIYFVENFIKRSINKINAILINITDCYFDLDRNVMRFVLPKTMIFTQKGIIVSYKQLKKGLKNLL